MKKKIISIIACTLVLGISIIGCGSKKEKVKSGFEKIKNSSMDNQMNLVGFNDKDFAIGIGFSGAVDYTKDGGKSWEYGNNESKCRFGLDIIDDKLAYNCGNGAHVRKTTDGGRNWTKVSNFGKDEPNHCRYIRFINEQIGWIASNNLLGITKDGAKTWQEIKLPEGISDIIAIDLLSETEGYIIDNSNKIYISKDGGATWKTKQLDLDNIDNNIEDTPKCAMKFINNKKGYIYYITKDGSLAGIYTEDGGENWKKEKLPKIDGGGYLYISRDAKYLTVTQDAGLGFVLLKRN